MAQPQTQLKNIVLIHNSSLPGNLGSLSTILATQCQICYCRQKNLTIRILDLHDYYISSPSSTSIPLQTTTTPTKKPLSEWQSEISQSSGLILLFPYHIWSHCNFIKAALSETIFPKATHLRAIISKPVLLVGFGKEDLWHPNKAGTGDGWTQRIWSRKSFSMMRDWAIDRGLNPIPPGVYGEGENRVEIWPEFNCFDDYWRTWEKTGKVVIGGQQSENWEPGHDKCQMGMGRMVEMLERKK